MIDITQQIQSVVKDSNLSVGICTIFCTGSTGSVITIEYEGGLLMDFPEAMNRIAPKDIEYHHDLKWHDGNGHSHVRASVVGPSLTVPFVDGRLTLGTWQQIVFVDFDNRVRERTLKIVMIGD